MDIHFKHNSAINVPGLNLGEVFVGNQSVVMPLHFFWSHNNHCEYRVDLQLTPLEQTQLSMPAFDALGLAVHSCWVSARWAPGRQRKEARKVHQCGTHEKAPPAPEWRAVGYGQNPDAHWLLCLTPHCTDHWPAHDSGQWSTCSVWHAQPIHRPPGSLKPTIRLSLAH